MLKEIGKVNFGTVNEVERVEDGKIFAQKVFAIPEKGSIVKYLNNNMKEAELIKTLKHPNII